MSNEAILGAIQQSDHGQLTSLLESVDCTAAELGHCLGHACASGETECVRLLLAAHAAVDQADKKGCTPLIVACCKGHVECAQLLLAAHAAINQAEKDGGTPHLRR